LQVEALNLVKTQAAMLSSAVYPDVRIYTPDPNGGSTGSQEFMQVVTPEPGTLPLAAGALLVAVALAVRRQVRKRHAR
jgi:MYXO-CTERM domain-containing protein